jgi:hypothetical protein
MTLNIHQQNDKTHFHNYKLVDIDFRMTDKDIDLRIFVQNILFYNLKEYMQYMYIY